MVCDRIDVATAVRLVEVGLRFLERGEDLEALLELPPEERTRVEDWLGLAGLTTPGEGVSASAPRRGASGGRRR